MDPSRTLNELKHYVTQFFKRPTPLVLIGTGPSCAIDPAFGMNALAEHLLNCFNNSSQLTETQKLEWSRVEKSLKENRGLESALDCIDDTDLIEKITIEAGNYVAKTDHSASTMVLSGEIDWKPFHLLKKMVETLPESPDDERILHIITPNYDMLLEYACANGDICYINGYSGGVHKRSNWGRANCSIRTKMVAPRSKKTSLRITGKDCPCDKHIRLYKVHGSLNLFNYKNKIVECDLWTHNIPAFAKRVVIAPGKNKHEIINQYRRELQFEADNAVDNAEKFLFIGFGFNDSHIEEYIRRKLLAGKSGLIVTRDWNERIQSLLNGARNVKLICMSRNTGNDTEIHSYGKTVPDLILEKSLWDVNEFYQYFFT